MKKLIRLLTLILAISGCATTIPAKPLPTKEELAKMDYGKPLSIDYEKVIKDYFTTALKDPYTAQYQFAGQPQPFWYRDSPMMGGKEYIGYAVVVLVNAKNSFGGYVGDKQYAFIFHDDSIIKIVSPEEFELMGLANSFKQNTP